MTVKLEGAALLGIAQEAGLGILTLTEYLERDELLRSRLTRDEVRRLLLQLADALLALPATVWQAMPELDLQQWQALRRALDDAGPEGDEALWFGVKSLVPATLLWLRVHRRGSPELFEMTP